MEYTAFIWAVDSKISMSIERASLKEIREFFKAHDHEGSSINFTVNAYGVSVFRLIEMMEEEEKKHIFEA